MGNLEFGNGNLGMGNLGIWNGEFGNLEFGNGEFGNLELGIWNGKLGIGNLGIWNLEFDLHFYRIGMGMQIRVLLGKMGLVGCLTIVSVIAWTLVPNSHSLMVVWPGVLFWQVGGGGGFFGN